VTSSDPLLDARIYIAEDDQLSRELLEARLDFAGFKNVTSAKDGREAVNLLNQGLPDIMLLDVMMPYMDGYQVIEYVRKTWHDTFVPIVLLSAASNPEHRIRGIEAGATDFLSKPYDHEELIARVRSLLEHKQAVDLLNTERARMDALLTQVGNPVIVTDTNGLITQVNPAAQHELRLRLPVTGMELGSVFGLALEDLLVRARERGEPVSGVHTLRVKPPATFNVSVSPIEAVGYILFWQDITALQEAEHARLEAERSTTRHVLNTFSSYMSPSLVERVLQDTDFLVRSEQREVTVMFADLRGFTNLSVRQSPDTLMSLLNEIYTDMLDVVNSREGLVLDIVGDELMVAFNAPYPQDFPVQRAVETAVAIHRTFNKRRQERQGRDLQVGLGIGINCGPVVLGPVGGPSHKSYTMVGETVNVAHRLVDLADDRQIIMSSSLSTSWHLDDDRVVVSDLGIAELKGVPDPIQLSVIEVIE
jgi:class 3 adenylate cyclase/DNA-binding response OmpR family regulator